MQYPAIHGDVFFNFCPVNSTCCIVFHGRLYSLDRALGISSAVDSFTTFFLIKNDCWGYEQEWRMNTMEYDSYNNFGLAGLVEVPVDAIHSVILGLNADKQVEALAKIFCAENNHISLYRSHLHDTNYGLEIGQSTLI